MQRIPSLDGLRAISITLVILSHLVKWKHIPLPILGNYGAIGVHVFFVLSGYLITSLLLKEYDRTSTISLREFYIRRAFRIFPAASVFLTFVTIFYWHQMHWYHIAAALLYVANMDVGRPWIFGHLWSLSIEEQFYLLWPFALKKYHRHKTEILLCVFIFTPVFRTGLYAGCPTHFAFFANVWVFPDPHASHSRVTIPTRDCRVCGRITTLAPCRHRRQTHAPNLSAARALALAASSSRFFGGALVSSERRRRVETPATSSTAARNAPSFAFDGLLNPLIFLTNCSEAARISSSVTGGSKLKRILIFRHI